MGGLALTQLNAYHDTVTMIMFAKGLRKEKAAVTITNVMWG
jgi:hypothetical protein